MRWLSTLLMIFQETTMTDKVGTVFVSILSAMLMRETVGHGAIIDPPARNYMGMAGFPVQKNYDYTSLYCGGFYNQQTQEGKCGICGDPWQGPREHEAGGQFATDIIGRCYSADSKNITVQILITAWHKGYFIFKMCPHNNPKTNASQHCFDQYPLQLVDGGYKYDITNNDAHTHNILLNLPQGLTCTQCILQWTYIAGNNWGCDGENCGLGLGSQENFVNCADIAILSDCTNVTIANMRPPVTSQILDTNSPSYADGSSCHAIGEWTGDPDINEWCVNNCLASTPFCPADICVCGSADNPSGV
ncbi:hypothetical protein CHS0354_037179 [Potamilus streckersoni]|uniref:Chitin-binding type-4 domain-containing protein n=1 Tax=Potamilus streckersoni TaxID=2493646 RepID=A0AAE0SX48_9BIVA|nr:hypothetical protein CHS0354_037179 [Potamilus streckersoni]